MNRNQRPIPAAKLVAVAVVAVVGMALTGTWPPAGGGSEAG